jgi:putative multiple sugar transport system ATP-binding protein
MEHPLILQMQGITKLFPGVRALDDVTLEVRRGTIHAICGENGAGKSTLMKVLSGVYPYGSYEGKIIYLGSEMKFKDIKESERACIAIIHQELAMIPELSITENIFLGNEIMKCGLIDWETSRERAIELLETVGLSIDPNTLIKNLGIGQQQLVEIAKALSKNVKLLILDEPTSALNEDDSANLLDLMRGLVKQDITCIMISHKLNEIAAVSDAVTVIRDGRTVETYAVEAGFVDENRIICSMVGRSIENRYPDHESHPGEVIFEVSDWRVEDPNIPGRMICKDSSFFVRAGEIVGFAGLMGAGRTELMRSIFGRNYGIYHGGTIKMKGKEIHVTSVDSAIRQGIAYVPEDRKNLGLNLLDNIRKTTVAANLK